MSNLSNIGFDVTTSESYLRLLQLVYPGSHPVKVKDGAYYVHSDASGAELYLRFNRKKECIGSVPHFRGQSRRTVCLTEALPEPGNPLDGAFHAWADPAEKNDPDSGTYPFVFDVPDFTAIGAIDYPQDVVIQLVGFAQHVAAYASEAEFEAAQTGELKFAVQSFIPNGLFSFTDDAVPETPQATGVLTGRIKAVEKRRNTLTGLEFYWMLVDTLGGEIDIVADPRYFEAPPVVDGVVEGDFWLSGRLVDPPTPAPQTSQGA